MLMNTDLKLNMEPHKDIGVVVDVNLVHELTHNIRESTCVIGGGEAFLAMLRTFNSANRVRLPAPLLKIPAGKFHQTSRNWGLKCEYDTSQAGKPK